MLYDHHNDYYRHRHCRHFYALSYWNDRKCLLHRSLMANGGFPLHVYNHHGRFSHSKCNHPDHVLRMMSLNNLNCVLSNHQCCVSEEYRQSHLLQNVLCHWNCFRNLYVLRTTTNSHQNVCWMRKRHSHLVYEYWNIGHFF